jgi:large exoprotein involved in heme utilization and adhesion
VVRASGDVAFDSYTGASLHILAGGNVAIGNVVITGPDALGNGLQESVPLSDGSGAIAINGNTQPTLDVRAGTLAVGTPGITPPTAPGFVPPLPNPNGTPTGANITIGSVTNPSGLVLITNQYQPNLTLTGDITVGTLNTSANPTARLPGGDVAIDSRGALTVSNINVSGGSFSVTPGTNAPRLSTINVGGNSGNVTLLADGTLTLPYPATIYALGLRGGEISLASDTTIVQANAPFGVNAQTLSWVESLSVAPVPGGDLRLSAPTILVGGNLLTTHLGRGTGGDIVLNSDTLVTNQASINTRLVGTGTGGDVLVTTGDLQHTPFSSIGAFNFGGGQGGNVVVQAETLTATGGAQIGAATSGVGAAGDVTVTADTIALSGFLPANLSRGAYFPTTITSSAQPRSRGNSGNVTITTDTLSLAGGAAIGTQTFGTGNAGDITIDAATSVALDGAVYVPFVMALLGLCSLQRLMLRWV